MPRTNLIIKLKSQCIICRHNLVAISPAVQTVSIEPNCKSRIGGSIRIQLGMILVGLIDILHVVFENEGRQRYCFINIALCLCGSYDQVKLRNRNFVTCTLFSLLWYEIKDVPIYRCKSFKFRTLGVKFRYIYCS